MLFFFVLTLFSLSHSSSHVRPSDGPMRLCGTNLTQHSADTLGKYDLWDDKGNEDLLKALNAALKVTNTEWGAVATDIGSENLPMTGTFPWPDANTATGTFKMILDTGKIRFGSTFTLPPLGSREDNCFTGKEMELGNMIAREFSSRYGSPGDIQAEWVQLSKSGDFWFDISFALSGAGDFKNDKPDIDVILSSVTNTESRRNGGKARFTNAYVIQKYGVLVSKAGQDAGITTKEDLDNPAFKVSVTGGATNEQFAKDNYPKCEIVTTVDFNERMDNVKTGKAHFGIGDAVTVKYYKEKNCPDCLYLGNIGDKSFPLGMAVRPARQPTNERPRQTCKILKATSSAKTANCYRKTRTSSCYECDSWDDDCYYALQQKKAGKCCLNEYCCKETRSSRSRSSSSRSSSWGSSRCSRSVEKEGEIRCEQSYAVTIEAEGEDVDTKRKVIDRAIRYDCETKKFCADNLKKKAGQTVNCSITLDGQSIILDIGDPLSVASHHSISLLPLMFLMVWFLIR